MRETQSVGIFASNGMPLVTEDVRAQLARIVGSAPFLASRRMTQFLSFVVEETLSGRAAQIKEYTIAVKAMDRPATFDPQMNPAVRIQAGRLRRALDQYYADEGLGDLLQIEIPRGTYVPIFHLRGRLATAKSPDITSLAEDQMPSSGPALAIVIFSNLSQDPEKEYFAVGFTESLTAKLAQFRGVRIVGPLSPHRFASGVLDFGQISGQYNVQFVLHGSIRWQGQMLRIVANLVDVATAETIWADSFDSHLDGALMLDIEDDIIARINGIIADYRGVIHRKASGRGGAGSQDFTVYEAMLRYYHFLDRLATAEFEPTVQALQQARDLDPENALILAMLGEMLALDYMYDIGLEQDRLARAQRLARRAIAIDPRSQHARAVLAEVHFLRGERASCHAELEQLLALNPNHPSFIYFCGSGFAMLGEWERGVALVRKAIHLNPHYPAYYHFVFFLDEFRRGHYETALLEAQRIDAPGLIWGPFSRALALAYLDRIAESQAELAEVMQIAPDFEERKQDMLRRAVFSDENVDMLLQGLAQLTRSLSHYAGASG